MENLISQEAAIDRLRILCEDYGSMGALADKIGVDISAISHQLKGRRPIQGKVAQFMGLQVHRETTISYKKVSA